MQDLIEYVKFRPSKDKTADDVRQDWAEINYILVTFERMFNGKTSTFKRASWYWQLLGRKWLYRQLCCNKFRRATKQEAQRAESMLKTLTYNRGIRDNLFDFIDVKLTPGNIFTDVANEDIDEIGGIVDRRIKKGDIESERK